jgi:hypothetical protein
VFSYQGLMLLRQTGLQDPEMRVSDRVAGIGWVINLSEAYLNPVRLSFLVEKQSSERWTR